MINIFFLAANLFALTAFLLGLNNFATGVHSRRLLPLFLLVTSRAMILIISLFAANGAQAGSIAMLEVFSTFCLVWALVNPATRLSPFWNRLAWGGGVTAVLLSVFLLFPGWPVPTQIHSLSIAIFGIPFILVSRPQKSWLYISSPLILSIANFLSLLALISVSWLLLLLAYAALIAAVHWDGLLLYRRRQARSEAKTREAIHIGRERQRLLDVSQIISAIPNVDQAMPHLARSMAHVTGADQAAIFILDLQDATRFHLATIYSPERPVELTGRYESAFAVSDYSPLERAVQQQAQLLLLPQHQHSQLASFYALWFEERIGPSLIQPLCVQGQTVGVLLLGNPVTHHPFKETDQVLCQNLGMQMAAMVDSYRHYRYRKTEKVAVAAPVFDLLPEPEAEADVVREAEAIVSATMPEGDGYAVESHVMPPWPEPIVPRQAALDWKTVDPAVILEAILEGVVVSDVGGMVQFVNKSAERILGRTRSELLGRSIGLIYGEIDSGESIESLAASFSRRNEPLPTFTQNNNKAIQGQLVPWRNKDKEWMGIIAVFKDVTGRVKADQARNNFITALSRELRAPLTTIKGYSELILQGVIEDYSPEQLHVQRIIHSGVDRMVAVLDNAIQIGAQQKNKVLPHFENVDVADVINQVIEEITPFAELHEITLTKEVAENLPHISADRIHLRRILRNLLENACQFTPPGGYVTLKAWEQNKRAGNTFIPELVLMISDNGVGISRTEARRIFEPFYQIQGVLESGGMGMGLTVVKELVEIHHGRVWVESAENEGSIFQVALPVTQG